jgi:hypothetical protein
VLDWGILAVSLLVLAAVPMTLNARKFGNPLQSGYGYIHADVEDHLAGIGQWHGLFSYRYIPQNFYYMNLRVPPVGIDDRGRLRYQGDYRGSSIWITTPILVFFWIDIRRHWKVIDRRILILAMVPIFLGLLMYFNTGSYQKGYNRFALDFLAPVLLMVSPYLFGPVRRWISIPLILVSIVYFRWLMDFLF